MSATSGTGIVGIRATRWGGGRVGSSSNFTYWAADQVIATPLSGIHDPCDAAPRKRKPSAWVSEGKRVKASSRRGACEAGISKGEEVLALLRSPPVFGATRSSSPFETRCVASLLRVRRNERPVHPIALTVFPSPKRCEAPKDATMRGDGWPCLSRALTLSLCSSGRLILRADFAWRFLFSAL